ncbi:MAG: hypothetical protein Q8Q09_08670 [Deltaproteobacteria bacterium]|nr:hypothetical protein [Deltaproteobacteria bacterium]
MAHSAEMGFNQNPHVAKATVAELSAQNATDEATRCRSWLEAAHLWERAADREKNEKRASEYRVHAERAHNEAEPRVATQDRL